MFYYDLKIGFNPYLVNICEFNINLLFLWNKYSSINKFNNIS